MKQIVSAALLSLTTASISLVYPQVAKANPLLYCAPVTDYQIIKNSADHPHAYADGFRQGEQSARSREAYKPRTAGGEFARGFEDGYYNRPYTGQRVIIPNKIALYPTQNCVEGYGYDYPVAPFPGVIYNYPSLDFGLGFGGWGHYGGWHHGRW